MQAAHQAYAKALALMAPEEYQDFTINSVVVLLQSAYKDQFKKFNEAQLRTFIDRYWKMSNPLFLTDYNERLLEHYSRVAFANLHFSVSKKNLQGWKTDRGEIVLRYGEPLNRIRLRPAANLGALVGKTEVWYYKDMAIMVFQPAAGNCRLKNLPKTVFV